MRALTRESSNLIAAVEVLAVWAAYGLWGEALHGRAVITFVDNDSAKHALVKGSSPIADMAAVVDAACGLEIRHRLLCYFERVPSSSNIADDPSRGVAPLRLCAFGAPIWNSCSRLGAVPASGLNLKRGIRNRSMV